MFESVMMTCPTCGIALTLFRVEPSRLDSSRMFLFPVRTTDEGERTIDTLWAASWSDAYDFVTRRASPGHPVTPAPWAMRPCLPTTGGD